MENPVSNTEKIIKEKLLPEIRSVINKIFDDIDGQTMIDYACSKKETKNFFLNSLLNQDIYKNFIEKNFDKIENIKQLDYINIKFKISSYIKENAVNINTIIDELMNKKIENMNTNPIKILSTEFVPNMKLFFLIKDTSIFKNQFSNRKTPFILVIVSFTIFIFSIVLGILYYHRFGKWDNMAFLQSQQNKKINTSYFNHLIT